MKSLKSIFIIITALFASFAITQATAVPTSSFSPSQQQQIKKIIHNYIIQNPEILVEASQALQKKRMEKMQTATIKATRNNINDVFHTPKDIVVGNPNGKITLVEFYDYQCPYCHRMDTIVNDLAKTNPELRVVLKDFIVHGEMSLMAAEATMAAYNLDKGKYIPFHNALLSIQRPLVKKDIIDAAQKAGYNVNKLLAEMKNPKYKTLIEANSKLAYVKLKLIGTPAFIIANTNIKTGTPAPITVIPGMTSEQELQNKIDSFK